MTIRRKMALPLLAGSLGSMLLLSACNQAGPEKAKEQPKAKVGESLPLPDFEGDNVGTPMTERVAVIGLLNKRTGESRDLELKPGQEIRFGKVVIRLRACERTRPWETFPDEGAFIQMDVRQRPAGTNDAERLEKVFSGWLFKENPAANVVQHPIYDVWVKACKMSFPGEEAPPPAPQSASPPAPAANEAPKPAPSRPSNAPQSAPPAAEPEPEEEPAEIIDEDEPEVFEELVIET